MDCMLPMGPCCMDGDVLMNFKGGMRNSWERIGTTKLKFEKPQWKKNLFTHTWTCNACLHFDRVDVIWHSYRKASHTPSLKGEDSMFEPVLLEYRVLLVTQKWMTALLLWQRCHFACETTWAGIKQSEPGIFLRSKMAFYANSRIYVQVCRVPFKRDLLEWSM